MMANKDKLILEEGYQPPAVSSQSSLESLHAHSTRGSSMSLKSTNNFNDRTRNQQQPQTSSILQSAPPSTNSSVISPATTHPNTMMGVPSSLVLPPNQILPLISSAHITGSSSSNVPEFLYQLTKMLNDNNKDVIEWTNGMIEVHNPHKLENNVLHKYFRHSKFASFQRQLNYFGFRKLAGKGKMAPCSYVNEAVKGDISNLLLIKRKSSATTVVKEKIKENKPLSKPTTQSMSTSSIRQRQPGTSSGAAMSGIVRTSPRQLPARPADIHPGGSYLAIAQSAVGRGIRHGLTASIESRRRTASMDSNSTNLSNTDQTSQNMIEDASKHLQPKSNHTDCRNDNLCELANNYRNSLANMQECQDSYVNDMDPTPLSELCSRGEPYWENYQGMFSRDTSLVNLAILPSIDESNSQQQDLTLCNENLGLSFIDFPDPSLDPSQSDGGEPISKNDSAR